MTDTEAAYAAGFIDGEGCLTILKTGRSYRAALVISNNDVACLEFLRGCLGGRIYRMRGQVPNRNASGRGHQLHVTGADLAAALRLLIPHLIGKQAQAELLAAFLIDCGGRQGLCLTERQHAVRHAYFLHLKALKRAV